MSLVQLNYFLIVAEEQHLGRAASRLHISQPPLTRQIRSLEEELGQPLFARTSAGMELLPAGRRLYPEVQKVLGSVAKLRDHLSEEGRLPQPSEPSIC